MMDHGHLSFAAATVALLLSLAGCDGPVSPEVGDVQRSTATDPDDAGLRLAFKPFRAGFFTDGAGLAPDPACGDPPRFLNTQVGEGEATHLGRFTVRITFCIDATDVLDDGLLTEGESLPYDRGFGVLTAANGDELHIRIDGAVLPSHHPDFDFEFRDRFRFSGGTGRFEGAHGGGTTESYVDQSADRTQHDWAGFLRLPGDAEPPGVRRRDRAG